MYTLREPNVANIYNRDFQVAMNQILQTKTNKATFRLNGINKFKFKAKYHIC